LQANPQAKVADPQAIPGMIVTGALAINKYLQAAGVSHVQGGGSEQT
jgi:hypothetical protein